jgi:hypothetical protein
MIYCVKCKKKTKDGKITYKYSKNGRKMASTKCETCGTQKNQFVSNQKGGNAAIVGAIAGAVPDTIRGIGDAVDQSRKTTYDFEREEGKVDVKKDNVFMDYYRNLEHVRYWDPSKLPPKLRLKKFGIDPPSRSFDASLKDNLEQADEALYNYAYKKIYKTDP